MTRTTRTTLPLLATCSLVVAGAALVPAVSGQDAPRNTPAAAAAAVGQEFRVPYRLTDTNHYLVRVRLNGKGPFNFLVDSGAPALFVGTEAARAVGLDPAEDDFWTPVDRLDIEGGIVLTDLKARVEDPFQLVGMNALGLPGASIDGILGFTILARFRLEFDPTDDRMTWTRIAFEPQEPFIPKALRTKQGPAKPAEVRAMEMLGPVMKVMAAFTGRQPEETLLPRGFLGVELEEADGGPRVAAVLEGSPAAAGGVEPGDHIVRIAERRVANLDAAREAFASVRPGDPVTLRVRRAGAADPLTLTLTAGEGF